MYIEKYIVLFPYVWEYNCNVVLQFSLYSVLWSKLICINVHAAVLCICSNLINCAVLGPLSLFTWPAVNLLWSEKTWTHKCEKFQKHHCTQDYKMGPLKVIAHPWWHHPDQIGNKNKGMRINCMIIKRFDMIKCLAVFYLPIKYCDKRRFP